MKDEQVTETEDQRRAAAEARVARGNITIALGAGIILGGVATDKGYNDALFSVTRDLPHPLGEMVYKIIRYNKTGNIQDLEKLVAWAELEYRHAIATRGGKGNTEG
jgi:hypothetical protein